MVGDTVAAQAQLVNRGGLLLVGERSVFIGENIGWDIDNRLHLYVLKSEVVVINRSYIIPHHISYTTISNVLLIKEGVQFAFQLALLIHGQGVFDGVRRPYLLPVLRHPAVQFQS